MVSRYALAPTLKSIELGKPKEKWSEDLEKRTANSSPHDVSAENIVLTKKGIQTSILPPSLDINAQNSPCKDTKTPFSKKQKRIYSKARTGLTRCEALGQKPFFLTLTSAPKSESNKINSHWQSVVQRVRREMNFQFEYMKVETSEGNGVIHALFHSAFIEGFKVEVSTETDEKYNPINFRRINDTYNAIHAYFSTLWEELHGAFIVWCSPVLKNKKVAGYMTQYVSNQTGYLRSSQSLKWIWSGWRKRMLGLIKAFGFTLGISIWNMILKNPLFNPFYNYSQVTFVMTNDPALDGVIVKGVNIESNERKNTIIKENSNFSIRTNEKRSNTRIHTYG